MTAAAFRRRPTQKDFSRLRRQTRSTYDGYHYFDDVKSRELRKQLFIGCDHLYKAWSANENGGYGWALDGQDNLGDYKYYDVMPVLFVRTDKREKQD